MGCGKSSEESPLRTHSWPRLWHFKRQQSFNATLARKANKRYQNHFPRLLLGVNRIVFIPQFDDKSDACCSISLAWPWSQASHVAQGGDTYHHKLNRHQEKSSCCQQGCINRGTCSHPELTQDQVLTSAYDTVSDHLESLSTSVPEILTAGRLNGQCCGLYG